MYAPLSLVSHVLFHKAGPLCCFTCLNICFMKIMHIIDIYVIYLFVWRSHPFLELLPRPIFSPLFSTPSLACYGCIPCLLIQRRGEKNLFWDRSILRFCYKSKSIFKMCNVWMELASDMRLGWLPLGPTLHPPLFPSSTFLPLPSLQRASPQCSPKEHLARAGHSLGSRGLRIWLHCQLLMTP